MTLRFNFSVSKYKYNSSLQSKNKILVLAYYPRQELYTANNGKYFKN